MDGDRAGDDLCHPIGNPVHGASFLEHPAWVGDVARLRGGIGADIALHAAQRALVALALGVHHDVERLPVADHDGGAEVGVDLVVTGQEEIIEDAHARRRESKKPPPRFPETAADMIQPDRD